MNANEQKYWFSPDDHGWGWGLPASWQGWLFFIGWFAAYILGRRTLVPHNLYAHLAFAFAMLVGLLGVCYLKGKPPRWSF